MHSTITVVISTQKCQSAFICQVKNDASTRVTVSNSKESSIKDAAQNREKLTPPSPLSEKCPQWTNPPLPPCLCEHTINFEKSKVFTPKSANPLVRKMSALDKLS